MTISCEGSTVFDTVVKVVRNNHEKILLVQSASPLAKVKPLNDNRNETFKSLCTNLPLFKLIEYKKIIIDCKGLSIILSSGIVAVSTVYWCIETVLPSLSGENRFCFKR